MRTMRTLVTCDHGIKGPALPLCNETLLTSDSDTGCTMTMQAQGWTTEGGRDLCPHHA